MKKIELIEIKEEYNEQKKRYLNRLTKKTDEVLNSWIRGNRDDFNYIIEELISTSPGIEPEGQNANRAVALTSQARGR